MPTPVPQELSRDLQLIGLAPERPLEIGDPPALLGPLGALLAGREALHPGLQRLLASTAEQALADVVLAAELGDAALAAPARHHQLELLLRRELPVPACLAQRRLLVRRAADPLMTPGRSLAGF